MAIGDRSQAARTYLEKNLAEFPNANLDQLIMHSIAALRATVHSTVVFSEKSCSISVVGKDYIKNLSEEEIKHFVFVFFFRIKILIFY